jgi:chromosome segregation ATPase
VKLLAEYLGEEIEFDIAIEDKPGTTPFKRLITYRGIVYKNSECPPLLDSFGIDYLQHIMFSLQSESNITDMKPSERSRILKKIFNFEFDEELQSLDKQSTQDAEEIIKVTAQIGMLERNTYEITKLHEVLTPTETASLLLDVEKLNSDIYKEEQLNVDTVAIKKRIEEIRLERDRLANNISKIETDIKNKEIQVEAFNKDILSQEGIISTVIPDNKFIEDIAVASSSITYEESRLQDIVDLLSHNRDTLSVLKESKNRLVHQLDAFSKGLCDKCNQEAPVSEVPEIESSLAEVSSEILKITGRMNVSEKSRSEIALDISRKNKALYALQAQRTSEANKLERSQTTLASLRSYKKTNEIDIQNSRSALAEAKLDLGVIQKRLTVAESDAPEDHNILVELRTQLESKKEKLDNGKIATKRNEDIQKINDSVVAKKTKDVEELGALRQKQNGLSNNILAYEAVRKLLTTDLPNYVIVKACSRLEKSINGFIASVKPGMIIRLQQSKGGVEFYYSPADSDDDEWISAKMASGFEGELLSVSWRVALSTAFGLKALMLDEVDSAASVDDSEKMIKEILNTEGLEQFLIISHKPSMPDILRAEAENVNTIRFDKGVLYPDM